MKKDLNKNLTERQRLGSKKSYSEVRNKKEVTGKQKLGTQGWPWPGESTSPYPIKEGIKKPYGWNTKSFNEHLNPLWGYIHKSVGATWNNLYSELSREFDKRKVINQHIFQHLFQNVTVYTRLLNNKLEVFNNNKWVPLSESTAEYYVHPVSKILLKNNEHKSWKQKSKEVAVTKKAEVEQNLICLSKFSNQNGTGARYAIKIKDLWYEISVIKTPEPTKHRRAKPDGTLEYFTRYPEVETISINGAKYTPEELKDNKFYVSRKSQLSSANLKKHSLTNG